MALIENTMFGRVDRVKVAVDRIRAFDPLTMGIMDTPYYVAYSGGKDSDAIRILCELAGVRHDLVNNHTTVDAPETVRYIRSIPHIKIEYPKQTMWQLIVKKGTPPTRTKRYCCLTLKETGGKNRMVMTGVRWAESANRKSNRGLAEVQASSVKRRLILNNDNDETRRMMENCQVKGKRVINPIIDWSDQDVWELLREYGCAGNPLYQCGYKRIGCVGCPMSSKQVEELDRYPKYKAAYIRAFDRMVVAHGYAGRPGSTWIDGISVYQWWVGEKHEDQIKGQIRWSDDNIIKIDSEG